MRRALAVSILSMLALAACRDDGVVVVDGVPAAPEAVSVSYYAGAVTVSWELAPDWNGEAFRIYSRRVTDPDFFFIAEVTSCTDGFCTYQDLNVTAGETYEYFVAAVSPDSGTETDSGVVEVFVPSFTPPPVPNGLGVIALDNALYLAWSDVSRDADDFSFYRVYQSDGGDEFLLGETDSEGFLDLLAGNGITYSYFITAVDRDGHESGGSGVASGTPRPDYHGELIRDWFVVPDESGFIFSEDETVVPIVPGDNPFMHFRLEADPDGTFWLVPGPGTQIHQNGVATTTLKCGPEADFDCVDLSVAPGSGYTTNAVQIFAGFSHAMRVEGEDGLTHYGVIRAEHLGADQTSYLMIFDWAYQLVPGSPDLTPPRD